MDDTITLHINEVTPTRVIRLRVTGVRKFAIRLKMLALLFKAAEWISPVPMVIDYCDVEE